MKLCDSGAMHHTIALGSYVHGARLTHRKQEAADLVYRSKCKGS